MKFFILGSGPPPPTMKNFSMYFFSETRPLLGHFLKKSVFCPPEMSNTCKNFQNPKIGQKWLSMGPPPFFSPKIFFTKMTQNGLKWILNTTLKSMKFCRPGPPSPPGMKNFILFFFNEGFP